MASFRLRRSTKSRFAGMILVLVMSLIGVSDASADGGAHSSIIGGSSTTIKKWPWHVAFLESKVKRPRAKPSGRYVCGGSLIAPTIVVTATHCAMEVDLSKPEYFSVIGGRTNLNKAAQGEEVLVKDAQFPLTRSGVPRYLLTFDDRWDLAVLELAQPLDQPTIKLAGPDETDLIAAGRVAYKTGWGVHRKGSDGGLSLILRKLRTAIQPAKACAYSLDGILGKPFDPDSQVCLGDPRTHSSPCYGDSGGPAVVRSSDGYRLFGATSYGTGFDCSAVALTVDAAIAQPDTREWIAGIAMERAGIDVVGTGATAGPIPGYCEIPDVEMMRLPQARTALRKNGCRPGKVRKIVIGHAKRYRKFNNKVIATRDSPFALRDPSHRVDIVIARWTRKHRRGE